MSLGRSRLNFGGFEVNFLPEYKALHDAGYNVLTYDLRNHGMSGQGNGGIAGIGLTEYRDVIGSLRYAASRADTKSMKKALLSVCLGADSTAVAWSKHPEEFTEVQAVVMLQPVSGRYIVEEFVKNPVEAELCRWACAVPKRDYGRFLSELSAFVLGHEAPAPPAPRRQVTG